MKRVLIVLSAIVLAAASLTAQTRFSEKVEFDKTVHDFGDIQNGAGPVSCTFTMKNISKSELTIFNVISSCGCTDATWTKDSIKPGESGTVAASFKNEDGPYPFDKTLTVYISGIKQPIILRIRGIAHDKILPLSERFPVHFGNFGMRSPEIKAGNLSQGRQKSGEVKVANLGSSPLEIRFTDLSEGLSLKVEPNPIEPDGTATLSYTVTASRDKWGKNWYYATPIVNGKAISAKGEPVKSAARGEEAVFSEMNSRLGEGHNEIGVWAFTKEDFSDMSREQKLQAPNPMFENSTYSFNPVKAGTKINLSFNCTNIGKSTLKFYKFDPDFSGVKIDAPKEIEAGGKGMVKATLDTGGLPAGEVLIVVTITTNAPLRPLVNLYITGFIK